MATLRLADSLESLQTDDGFVNLLAGTGATVEFAFLAISASGSVLVSAGCTVALLVTVLLVCTRETISRSLGVTDSGRCSTFGWLGVKLWLRTIFDIKA